jgi:WD40 repeat protein
MAAESSHKIRVNAEALRNYEEPAQLFKVDGCEIDQYIYEELLKNESKNPPLYKPKEEKPNDLNDKNTEIEAQPNEVQKADAKNDVNVNEDVPPPNEDNDSKIPDRWIEFQSNLSEEKWEQWLRFARAEKKRLKAESKVNCLIKISDNYVASASVSGKIIIWNLTDPNDTKCLEYHQEIINSMKVIHVEEIHVKSGTMKVKELLVSADESGKVCVWDLKTFQLRKTCQAHKDSITCMEALLDGRIISGSRDHHLSIWDITFKKRVFLKAHKRPVSSVVVLDYHRAMSASWDHTVILWQLDLHTTLCTINLHTLPVTHLLRPTAKRVVSAGFDGTLCVYKFQDKDPTKTVVIFEHTKDIPILSLAKLPDGTILSGSEDGSIKRWNILAKNPTEALIETLPSHHHSGVHIINVLIPQKLLVTGSKDGAIAVWNWNNKENITFLRMHAEAHLGGLFTAIHLQDFLPSQQQPNEASPAEVPAPPKVPPPEVPPPPAEEAEVPVVNEVLTENWALVSAGEDKTIKLWNNDLSEFHTLKPANVVMRAFELPPDSDSGNSGGWIDGFFSNLLCCGVPNV